MAERRPFTYKEVVAFKWGGDEILDEGFVPFPKRLLRCAREVFNSKMRMSELCAVLAIVDYARPQVTRKATLSYLASRAGMSEQRFRNTLKSLKRQRYVRWRGDEDAMEFDYTGLIEKVMELTSELSDDDDDDPD